MRLVNDGSTCPALIRSVADWGDHEAWSRFHGRYDRLLRSWCRGYGLDADSVDELSQVIWIEVADRMQTFCYDPSGRFRGLLRNVCQWRAIDFLRRRQTERAWQANFGQIYKPPATDLDLESADHDLTSDQESFHLHAEVQRIHQAVRSRVSERSWDAFWLVAVQDWPVEQTALSLGMTHTAVYAAKARVAKILAEEGNRMPRQGLLKN
jgi:RNA polymerase sigma factor (sigma-70 family)